jgi:arsenate reductase (thioredoxin)
MAEGFARRYGSDIMNVASAGLAPAPIVQPLTKKVMEAKNINIDDQYPKDLHDVELEGVDLIVNMSGNKLPSYLQIKVEDWQVDDPIGKSEETYVAVRDLLENQVMRLILESRIAARRKASVPPRPTAVPTPRAEPVARARFGRR